MWPDHNEAEVAFMVDEQHQGRGLATVLLEYLAVAARENGLDGLTATVLPTNRKMLGVFHDAGFQVASAFEEGVIEVRLGIEPTEEGLRLIEDRERRSEAASVTRLLSPSSIAVIGAGRERGGIGHEVFRNLVAGGFDGPVYPVNPAGGHVASVRAFQSVLDIPDAVDLAVVAVPAAGVLDVVEECGRKRVGGLVIFSAGFDRLPEGTEERIVERAHATGMRVIGPESMGVINTAPGVSLIANFGTVAVRPGNVGFLTQSGTLGLAALDHAHSLGVGFSTFVDVGSKIDVSGNDLLQYWAADERTTVVALHLQSFGNPRKFTRIVRELARAKPVVAVKSGLTRPGPEAGRPGHGRVVVGRRPHRRRHRRHARPERGHPGRDAHPALRRRPGALDPARARRAPGRHRLQRPGRVGAGGRRLHRRRPRDPGALARHRGGPGRAGARGRPPVEPLRAHLGGRPRRLPGRRSRPRWPTTPSTR